ncbi:MAG: transcription antitermination factor NusB [Bdellovibrionales bacterium]
MSVRSRSRELVLQLLFQEEFQSEVSLEQSLQLHKDSFESEPVEWDYAHKLLFGIQKTKEELDAKITDSSQHWKLNRMAIVDRNILRIASFEMGYLDLAKNIAINEAIELAKKYANPESTSFINGILDNIAKKS